MQNALCTIADGLQSATGLRSEIFGMTTRLHLSWGELDTFYRESSKESAWKSGCVLEQSAPRAGSTVRGPLRPRGSARPRPGNSHLRRLQAIRWSQPLNLCRNRCHDSARIGGVETGMPRLWSTLCIILCREEKTPTIVRAEAL